MGFYYAFSGFVAVYLLLVGRSAWKQGELAQFLRSLLVVAAVIALIVGIVEAAALLED